MIAAPTRPSGWVLAPTLAVGWIAFGQVLAFQGLAVWVVGGSLVTAGAVHGVSRAGRRLLGAAVGVVLTGLLPMAAEYVGGNTAGPITRATFLACGLSAAMALILQTRYPAALLLPSLLLVGGALGLGAATRAPWLVGLWAVAAAVTLAMLGPYGEAALADRRRLVPFSLVLVSVGLVGVLAVAVLAPLLSDPWTIPGSGQVAVPFAAADPTPDPTATSGPSSSATPPSSDPSASPGAPSTGASARPGPAASADAPPPLGAVEVEVEQQNPLVTWLLRVLAALLLALLVLLALQVLRRVLAATAWAWRRHRLRRGGPEQQVVGAWTWVRLRRVRYDQPLPVNASPDVAAPLAAATGEGPLAAVASRAAVVAFNPAASVPQADADYAWRRARTAGRPPGGRAERPRRRAERRGRGPAAARNAARPLALGRPHPALGGPAAVPRTPDTPVPDVTKPDVTKPARR